MRRVKARRISFNMLDILHEIEEEMPGLLAFDDKWDSVYIDYELPYVERIWRKHLINGVEYRINLHKIHPLEDDEPALYHPHPWPAAMVVLDGWYETGIGYGHVYDSPPPLASRMVIGPEVYYEMVEPSGWHYVLPLDFPVVTLMVTGPPYPKDEVIQVPPVSKELIQLPDDNKEWLLNFARDSYGSTH